MSDSNIHWQPDHCHKSPSALYVKWFNVKESYGFINRNVTHDNTFVHQTAITWNDPRKVKRNVCKSETAEFDTVAGENRREASNLIGSNEK